MILNKEILEEHFHLTLWFSLRIFLWTISTWQLVCWSIFPRKKNQFSTAHNSICCWKLQRNLASLSQKITLSHASEEKNSFMTVEKEKHWKSVCAIPTHKTLFYLSIIINIPSDIGFRDKSLPIQQMQRTFLPIENFTENFRRKAFVVLHKSRKFPQCITVISPFLMSNIIFIRKIEMINDGQPPDSQWRAFQKLLLKLRRSEEEKKHEKLQHN